MKKKSSMWPKWSQRPGPLRSRHEVQITKDVGSGMEWAASPQRKGKCAMSGRQTELVDCRSPQSTPFPSTQRWKSDSPSSQSVCTGGIVGTALADLVEMLPLSLPPYFHFLPAGSTSVMAGTAAIILGSKRKD